MNDKNIDIIPPPFPWFGGKSKVAPLIWSRFGDLQTYVEPFFGSGAVMFGRPTQPKVETVNDIDHLVANFWRAVKNDPLGVANWADNPTFEDDLTARHIWLVQYGIPELDSRLVANPDFYDVKIAGWWVWGICNWIGAGWCYGNGPWREVDGRIEKRERSKKGGDEGDSLNGINRKMVALTNGGVGVNRKQYENENENDEEKGEDENGISRRIIALSGGRGINRKRMTLHTGEGIEIRDENGTGVNRQSNTDNEPGVSRRLIHIGDTGRGINRQQINLNYPLRGANEHVNTALITYMYQLSDRLRNVRVCSGDWSRIVTRGALDHASQAGIFFDPPYSQGTGRNMSCYRSDSSDIAHDVRQWCIDNGDNPRYRIALCGYEGEHNELENLGWTKESWKAGGSYANSSNTENNNRFLERIWFNKNCLNKSQPELFLIEKGEKR